MERLPTEVVLMVYEHLGNIDDVLHLARACKYLYAMFNETRNRLRIFRRIINHSPQHERDLEICQFSRVHAEFSERRYSIPFEISIQEELAVRREVLSIENMESLGLDDDETVWDIVCRWQAMRLLFNLYVNKTLRDAYIACKDSAVYDNGVLISKNALPKPCGAKCDEYLRLDGRQKGMSYQRFYQALTAHWASTERWWFERARVHETRMTRYHSLDDAWKQWKCLGIMPVRECLDMVEVVDFVWGYLGHSMLRTSSLEDFSPPPGSGYQRGRLDDPSLDWSHYVHSALQYLRPPDIIEVLLMSIWEPRAWWELDLSSSMRSLGFFDPLAGFVEPPDVQSAASVPSALYGVGEHFFLGFKGYFKLCMTREDMQGRFNYDQLVRTGVIKEESESPGWMNLPPGDDLIIWGAYGKEYRFNLEIWFSDARGWIFLRPDSRQEQVARIVNRVAPGFPKYKVVWPN